MGAVKIGNDGVAMMGYLERKQTMETKKKKSTSKVWKQFYAVLKHDQILFYKDEQEAIERHQPIQTMPVAGGKAETVLDSKKKKDQHPQPVFKLALAAGSEYQMQAKSQEEIVHWIQR